jgi:hypothetical protein
MLKGFIPLLVPLEMSNHLLFLDKDLRVTVEAVKVFSIIEIVTLSGVTLGRAGKPFDVSSVVYSSCSLKSIDLGCHGSCETRNHKLMNSHW